MSSSAPPQSAVIIMTCEKSCPNLIVQSSCQQSKKSLHWGYVECHDRVFVLLCLVYVLAWPTRQAWQLPTTFNFKRNFRRVYMY